MPTVDPLLVALPRLVLAATRTSSTSRDRAGLAAILRFLWEDVLAGGHEDEALEALRALKHNRRDELRRLLQRMVERRDSEA